MIGAETCDDHNTSSGDGCSAACIVEFCGDTVTNNVTEACDDGNDSNTDSCLNTCASPSCGDSFVWVGHEVCDDANTDDGDYCSANCNAVIGTCQDNIVQTNEVCDDGNGVQTDACLNNCTPNTCGDGYRNIGTEACDDGNTANGDYCNSSCTAVTGSCMDGIVQTGEACDDGNGANTDACTNACQAAICSDGFIRAGVESCDDGNTSNGDGCSSSCQEEICGDGVVQAGEACDDGNAVNSDACSTVCAFTVCGDGHIQPDYEACDDGDASGGDGCSAACAVESGWACSGDDVSICGQFQTNDNPDYEPPVSAGGSRGGSSAAPSASGRRANGVMSTEDSVRPITGPGSDVLWFAPALKNLRKEEGDAGDMHSAALAPTAFLSRKEIDVLLEGIDWRECESDTDMSDDRKEIMIEARLSGLSTRGAIMKRIAELLCLPMGEGITPFRDLVANSPYLSGIRALQNNGLVTGYLSADGGKLNLIRADETITLAEVAVLIDRTRMFLNR